jgi:Xaa-Pro aminopeptidase
MPFSDKLQEIQRSLQTAQLDGWLFYDFRGSNDLACKMLELSSDVFLTRRFFYWIPKEGNPVKILHGIEDHVLNHLPGEVLTYHTWQELESHIATVLKNSRKIAMEYSPRNAIPYVSKIDAGTMDVVRGCGVNVVSSADLLQQYTSVWSIAQLQTHLEAADVLCKTVDAAWKFIGKCLNEGKKITEYDVQQFILAEFEKYGCITAGSPICAVNAHSANPHYYPDKDNAVVIQMGDFILIDLWCKKEVLHAVYADITRVGVAAEKPTERQQAIFDIVKRARDAATEFVKKRFSNKQEVMGWEVDRCCRNVIVESGFGDYFIHRTGHNIDTEDHGGGANIDSLETQDTRHLLPGTCFSIEPGIYLPGEFGVRLEYDVFVHHDGQVQVTGGIQEAITCLF